jgi:hypothetical protein
MNKSHLENPGKFNSIMRVFCLFDSFGNGDDFI